MFACGQFPQHPSLAWKFFKLDDRFQILVPARAASHKDVSVGFDRDFAIQASGRYEKAAALMQGGECRTAINAERFLKAGLRQAEGFHKLAT